MAYSLREAAEAVGKGKPAVLKAIQSGKISAHKNEHGEWQIEPVELHRVYNPVSETAGDGGSEEARETIGTGEGNGGNTLGNRLLEQELRFLREKLADIERMGEAERRALSERIEDLRGERDKLLRVIEEQAGSVKLLTDQRGQDRQQVSAAQVGQRGEDRRQRGFFGRLFGGRRG